MYLSTSLMNVKLLQWIVHQRLSDFALLLWKRMKNSKNSLMHWVMMCHNFEHFLVQLSRYAFTSFLLWYCTSSRSGEYRACICGYNNKIVNLRSHVIKVPNTEKNVVIEGKDWGIQWSYATSNILVMQVFFVSFPLSLPLTCF